MNKIEKVYEKLIDRLPPWYHVPIKIYKNSEAVIKAVAKKDGAAYKEYVKFFTEYIDKVKDEYDSKSINFKNKDNMGIRDIAAICGFRDTIRMTSEMNAAGESGIAYVILHETHHSLFENDTEREADEFAIKWVRRLMKEGVISQR